MRHRAGQVIALAAVVVVLTAGCADPVPPTGADQLVLRLVEVPGMLPSAGGKAQITPTYSLYGDGRLITSTATTRSPWPTLQEHRIAPEEIGDLLADAAALPESAKSEGPDAPGVMVTAVSTRERRTVNLPRSHGRVAQLLDALKEAAAGAGTPYQPEAVAVITTAGDRAKPARPWPLPTLTGSPLQNAAWTRCLVVRGPDLDLVKQATAANTIAISQWQSGTGESWQVVLRPLLPDEATCPSA